MATFFITGTNRGIGLELVRVLLQQDHRVFATCRNPESAHDLQNLKKESDHLNILKLDVRDSEQMAKLSQDLSSETIDCLINNAGIYGNGNQSVKNLDFDKWQEVLNVNTLSPLRVVQGLLPNLKRSENPKVISITSLMGSISENASGGHYAYRTSKAALNMAMKSLALDLKPEEITCAVIHPGWVQTDMGGKGATLSPQESVQGILQVIQNLSNDQSGDFFNYNGDSIPW